MLVLTRKQQETIVIGDSVTITVVRIQGNTVRVGIEAPSDVRVLRGEVRAREEAAGTAASAAALRDGGSFEERVLRRIAARGEAEQPVANWQPAALAAI